MDIVVTCAIGLVLAGVAIRGYDLGRADLTVDEEMNLDVDRLTYRDLFTTIAGRPPLSFVAQKAFLQIAGAPDPSKLRWPSVLEGGAGILVLYVFAYRALGFGAALLATTLLVVSPFHIEWSRDARYYPLLLFTCAGFAWCVWEVVAKRRPAFVVFAALFAVAATLTHQSGPLFLAACAVPMPLALFSRHWRELVRRNPRRTAAFAVALAAIGTGATIATWSQVAARIGDIKNLDFDRRLPWFFDVTPAFLLDTFREMFALPGSFAYPGVGLALAGAAVIAFRDRQLFVQIACVLVLPFALVWLFRPDHWWHPKYFIYILPPVYMLIGAALDACLRLAPSRTQPVAFVVVCVSCSAVFAYSVYGSLTAPETSEQQMGAALTRWTGPGDEVLFAWKERYRVLRHYIPPGPERPALSVMQAPPDFDVSNANRWYLNSGKAGIPADIAGALLSGEFSRTGFGTDFVAHGPNLQHIRLRGQVHELPIRVLVPRDGHRAVFVHGRCGQEPPATLTLTSNGYETAILTRTLASPDGAVTYLGSIDLISGPATWGIVENGGGPHVDVEEIECVPVLAGAGLEVPAWDFFSLMGTANEDSVWTERRGRLTLVRDLRGGQRLAYRIYVSEAGEYEFSLTALNDPPGPNIYRIHVPGVAAPLELRFDRDNHRISTLSAGPVGLQRGVYTIEVEFIAPSPEEIRERTNGLKVNTQQRLQNCGLGLIVISPRG